MNLESDIFGESTQKPSIGDQSPHMVNGFDKSMISNHIPLEQRSLARADVIQALPPMVVTEAKPENNVAFTPKRSLTLNDIYGLIPSTKVPQRSTVQPTKVITRYAIPLSCLYLDTVYKIPIDYEVYLKIEAIYQKITKSENKYSVPMDICKYVSSIVNSTNSTFGMHIKKDFVYNITAKFDDRSYLSPFGRKNIPSDIQHQMIDLDGINYHKCKALSAVMDNIIKRLAFKFSLTFYGAAHVVFQFIKVIHFIDSQIGLEDSSINFALLSYLNWTSLTANEMTSYEVIKSVILSDYSALPNEYMGNILLGFITSTPENIFLMCSRNRVAQYPGYPTYMCIENKPILIAFGKYSDPSSIIVYHGFLGERVEPASLYPHDVIKLVYGTLYLEMSLAVMDLFSDMLRTIVYIHTATNAVINECECLFTSAHDQIATSSGDVQRLYVRLMYLVSHPNAVRSILNDVSAVDPTFHKISMDRMSAADRISVYKAIFDNLSKVTVPQGSAQTYLSKVVICPCSVPAFSKIGNEYLTRCSI